MTVERPHRNWRRIFGVLLVVVVLFCAYSWRGGKLFDSDAWKSVAGNDPSRLAMVDDLLARRELVGMTRAAVDELLAVRPATGYFADFDYVYWLGPERGFMSIDSEWLCLDFDDDIVVKATLMRD